MGKVLEAHRSLSGTGLVFNRGFWLVGWFLFFYVVGLHRMNPVASSV